MSWCKWKSSWDNCSWRPSVMAMVYVVADIWEHRCPVRVCALLTRLRRSPFFHKIYCWSIWGQVVLYVLSFNGTLVDHVSLLSSSHATMKGWPLIFTITSTVFAASSQPRIATPTTTLTSSSFRRTAASLSIRKMKMPPSISEQSKGGNYGVDTSGCNPGCDPVNGFKCCGAQCLSFEMPCSWNTRNVIHCKMPLRNPIEKGGRRRTNFKN